MKILCCGDYISDVYLFGTATRLCPEAPVPVVVPQTTRTSAGGVGLVANQLRELGADVEEWRGSYSKKERIFVGNHLVTRIDTDSVECYPDDFPEISKFDVIVVSDYSKGAMSDELANKLRISRTPLFVDAKHHWGWYFGENTTIFPNQIESDNDAFNPEAFGLVVQKRGEFGACLRVPNGLGVDATVKDVVDVCGAGDVFMASFVYAWTLQFPAEDCLRFANEIAGESCRHRGTFVVGREFAQSVLDRLLVSAKSEQQVPDCTRYSTPAGHQQQHAPDRWGYRSSAFPEADNLHASLSRAEVVDLGIESNVRFGRILPEFPLDPKPVSDVPTPRQNDTEQDSKRWSAESDLSPNDF